MHLFSRARRRPNGRPTTSWHTFPRASSSPFYPYNPCHPYLSHPFNPCYPSQEACLPQGTTAAKGLAALPNGGISSHGHLGRASSFAKATEDKDARPSRGGMSLDGHLGADGAAPSRTPFHGHDGGEGSRRPTKPRRAFHRHIFRTEPLFFVFPLSSA